MWACGAEWPEWGLTCELEADHEGSHYSVTGANGLIGCWGGPIAHMTRVAAYSPGLV